MKKPKLGKTDYMNIGYDDLVTYALWKLQTNGKHTTFENLVSECFTLFPKRFQLPGYPNWPDSSLIERSWLRCRTDRGLILGSKSKGFNLTQKGYQLSLNVEKRLGKIITTLSSNKMKRDLRTRSGRLVNHIENSLAYKKYLIAEKSNEISEYEFCDLLYSTLDTEPALRKRNLEELKYHVDVYNRKDLLKFLQDCERKFINLLISPDREIYTGGMMKRRKKNG